MSGNDIISKVRRALHVADSIHTEDTGQAQQILNAAERCRDAQRDFLALIDRFQPSTLAAEQARSELKRRMSEMDCDQRLVGEVLDTGEPTTAQILTKLPPSQLH